MTDAAAHFSSEAMRCWRFAARLDCLFHRAVMAHETRRALNELPDDLLRDIGLNRSEIPYVADTLASGTVDQTRDARDQPERGKQQPAKARCDGVALPQATCRAILCCVCSVLAAIVSFVGGAALAQSNSPYSRGEYLSRIMDCGGCHTPGALTGKPDQTRALSGSEIGFHIPDLGYFYPPNLTPDRQTGLGAWRETDIIRAVRTGVRPDGRILAPVMPWHSYAALSDADAQALARYLRSLPPVRHAVPPLTGANETAPSPYLAVTAPKR